MFFLSRLISIILKKIKQLNIHSIDLRIGQIVPNPLKEVLMVCQKRQDLVAQIVHKCNFISLAHDDSFLQTVKKFFVGVSFKIWKLGLLNGFVQDTHVDPVEGGDHDEREKAGDDELFRGVCTDHSEVKIGVNDGEELDEKNEECHRYFDALIFYHNACKICVK